MRQKSVLGRTRKKKKGIFKYSAAKQQRPFINKHVYKKDQKKKGKKIKSKSAGEPPVYNKDQKRKTTKQ